ncbi:MAG TPA: outer membrane beta-barrel protein [bacterium]|nr:outer membrane beta-barrel protein [bacterium]
MPNLVKVFAVLFFCLEVFGAVPVKAQQSPTPTSTPEIPVRLFMSALIDTYYSFNFTNNAHGLNGAGNTGYFPDTQQDDTLNINMFELGFTLKEGEGSAHVSIIGGEVANYFESLAGATSPGDNIVPYEVYVAYHPQDWTFTLGRMEPYLGFEVLETNQNWNYSRSLLFAVTLPSYFPGLSMNYTSPDNFIGLTGYAFNGLNDAIFSVPLSQGKTYGLKLNLNPSADWQWTLMGITGPTSGVNVPPASDDVFAHYIAEVIAQWTASDKISLALDGEFIGQNPSGSQEFYSYGAALYFRCQWAPDWATALRLEGLRINGPSPVLLYSGSAELPMVPNDEGGEITLTLEHNFTRKFLGRLEGRYDYALNGGNTFAPGTGPFAGGDPDQMTVTASVVFSN